VPSRRWEDIDFERGFVHVRHQLDRKTRECVELKADCARDIVLVPQLATLLKAHRLASLHSADSDFVFPSATGRGWDHRAASRAVEAAVKRASLKTLARTRSVTGTPQC
jgi:integrase